VAKKEHTVTYSSEELTAKRKRGETRSDWARAAGMTDAEIETDIASDPDAAGMVVDWDSVSVEFAQANGRPAHAYRPRRAGFLSQTWTRSPDPNQCSVASLRRPTMH
jgi:hypothetical protein